MDSLICFFNNLGEDVVSLMFILIGFIIIMG